MRTRILALCAVLATPFTLFAQEKPLSPAELVRQAVQDIVKMQEEPGQWPYEGVYRVGGQIPVGYRVGGTAIVAGTLLHAAPKEEDAERAMRRLLDAAGATRPDHGASHATHSRLLASGARDRRPRGSSAPAGRYGSRPSRRPS